MYVLKSANREHEDRIRPARSDEGEVTPPGGEPPPGHHSPDEGNAPGGWAKSPSYGELKTLIYLDSREFTRDCVGRWLQRSLKGLNICVLRDPEQIAAAPIVTEQVGAVIIYTGPERMSSPTMAGLLSRVSELLPAVPVIVLSHYEDAENIRAAFGLGVRGYVPTSLASLEAAAAVYLVCAGGTFAPAAALLSEGNGLRGSTGGLRMIDGFTQRQAQILDCLRRGMANKLIAHELDMCESTVKVHIRNIMKKLNATNRTQVAYLTRSLFEGTNHHEMQFSDRGG